MRRTRTQKHQRSHVTTLATLGLLTLAGCAGPEARPEISLANGVATAAARPVLDQVPVALVVTDSGLSGVAVGASTPTWTADGAVAAPDGSAVFMLGPATVEPLRAVLRIDPRSGARSKVGVIPAPPAARVATVEAGGERIVLVTAEDDSTVVQTFDTVTGSVQATRRFEGTVDPEAFALDRTRLFAARIYGDYYNVHVLDLASGEQYPTLGPDKSKPPENMYGTVVQAALSPDRSQLATLYRDATKPGRTAFVHLLFLESGATFCIDLHAPFATGGRDADAIEWRDGMIVVGHRRPNAEATAATIDPQAVLDSPPQQHYPTEAYGDSTAPGVPSGVGQTPGFERFVALVPSVPPT